MSWMSFVEGFARRTSEIIRESETEARDYKEEMREMAERNRSKIQAMQESVKQNEAFVTRARNLGASDAQISMALDTSPTALRDMVTTLTDLKNNPATASTFGPEMISRVFVVSDDYKNINTDAAARFGGNFAVGDTAAPAGGGFFQDLYGVNAKGVARAELDQELLSGTNMSIFDAAGLGDFDFYNTLSPGTVGSFVQPQIMDAERTNTEMLRFNQKIKSILETTQAQYEAALETWRIRESNIRQDENRPGLTTAEINEYSAKLMVQVKASRERQIAQFFDTVGADVFGYRQAMAPLVAASSNDPLTQYAAGILDPTFDPSNQIGDFTTGTSEENGRPPRTSSNDLPFVNAESTYDPRRVVPIYQRGIEGVAYFLEPDTGRMFEPESTRFIANIDVRQIASQDPGLLSLTPDMSVEFLGQRVTQEMINSLMGIGTEPTVTAPQPTAEPAAAESTEQEAQEFIDMTPFVDQQEVRRINDYAAEVRDEIRQMNEDPTFIGTIGQNSQGSREEAQRRLQEALDLVQQRLSSVLAGSIPGRSEYIREGTRTLGLPDEPSTTQQAEYDNARQQFRREWNERYEGLYTTDGTPIMVEPRPSEAEAGAAWDRQYADTHKPNGAPLPQRRGS